MRIGREEKRESKWKKNASERMNEVPEMPKSLHSQIHHLSSFAPIPLRAKTSINFLFLIIKHYFCATHRIWRNSRTLSTSSLTVHSFFAAPSPHNSFPIFFLFSFSFYSFSSPIFFLFHFNIIRIRLERMERLKFSSNLERRWTWEMEQNAPKKEKKTTAE